MARSLITNSPVTAFHPFVMGRIWTTRVREPRPAKVAYSDAAITPSKSLLAGASFALHIADTTTAAGGHPWAEGDGGHIVATIPPVSIITVAVATCVLVPTCVKAQAGACALVADSAVGAFIILFRALDRVVSDAIVVHHDPY